MLLKYCRVLQPLAGSCSVLRGIGFRLSTIVGYWRLVNGRDVNN